MTTRTPIQIRFSDVDSFAHVNNVAQQAYFDLGKQDFYRRALPGEAILTGRRRIITASTSTSYLGQVHLGDELLVTTSVERVGTKSLTLFQQLIRQNAATDPATVNPKGPTTDPEVLAESRSVMVCFDFDLQASFPVPDAWRAALLG